MFHQCPPLRESSLPCLELFARETADIKRNEEEEALPSTIATISSARHLLVLSAVTLVSGFTSLPRPASLGRSFVAAALPNTRRAYAFPQFFSAPVPGV